MTAIITESAPSFVDVTTPLPTAPSLVDIERRQKEIDEKLLSACKDNDFSTGLKAINQGANVNYIVEGASCLMWATARGHLSIVSLLIARGADVNLSSGAALMNAANYGREEIIKILLDSGASIDAVLDNNMSTPLCFAASRNHTKIVKILVERGANVNLNTSKNTTPLMHAVSHQNFEMVETLLKAGAQLDVVNHQKKSVWTITYDYTGTTGRRAAKRMCDLLRKYKS